MSKAAQAPAASTTIRASIGPASVSTPRHAPRSIRNALTAVAVRTRAPRRSASSQTARVRRRGSTTASSGKDTIARTLGREPLPEPGIERLARKLLDGQALRPLPGAGRPKAAASPSETTRSSPVRRYPTSMPISSKSSRDPGRIERPALQGEVEEGRGLLRVGLRRRACRPPPRRPRPRARRAPRPGRSGSARRELGRQRATDQPAADDDDVGATAHRQARRTGARNRPLRNACFA